MTDLTNIKSRRIASFRRSISNRLHSVQSTSQTGFVFRETVGWSDGESKLELWSDGEFMQRWDADEWNGDPWSIDIFARLWSEAAAALRPNRLRTMTRAASTHGLSA
tara:strand:- start:4073 stop:4393 length:321 start_codon:yes stop_codon:yes gene_type:complete